MRNFHKNSYPQQFLNFCSPQFIKQSIKQIAYYLTLDEMYRMKKALILIFVIVSCQAQQATTTVDNLFYLKSHDLLDNIMGLNTKPGTIYTLDKYDFNNQRNLSESVLFDKIFKFKDSYYIRDSRVPLSQKEMDIVRDKNGWKTSETIIKENTWDASLFKRSKANLVQEYIKRQVWKPGVKMYVYVMPLQINFKGHFALIELKNLIEGGTNLRLYKYFDGEWLLIDLATDAKFSHE